MALPDASSASSASSASLILTHPSADEQMRHLLTVPLARDGGISQWILTDSAVPLAERPVLSSCETLRKRALVRGRDGQVRDVWAHGVASGFTYPEFRCRGYASKMLALFGERLARQEAEKAGEAAFSVLFSDIGKKYYAALGWMPYESAHLSFPVKPTTAAAEPSNAVKPILDADLPAIAQLDEELLRKKLSGAPADPAKTRVAIIPDLDTLQWHLARQAFMSNHLFSKAPTVHGASYTPPGASGSRVWGYWARIQHGGKGRPEINVLNFLRFVVEDDGASDGELSKAIRAIVGVAQHEAKEWLCTKINMWNPNERTKKLIADMKDLEAQYVVRESDSIPSLRWFGDGSVADVEWVANEKYEWC
ncbi:Lysine acetyltransferase [Tolypocladium ophioglossoides CBS 100239]|uniref:Lysine acetyltransferase n=1 Tax=Tolypocladium ophioglossoides (strain CBS 100239) TaxID=1163406 RepID=A0A0L0NFZ3_TOLOC|nr:Lysine acetyltransferase [Tolypocladium ophioglossoides CBS 100239]